MKTAFWIVYSKLCGSMIKKASNVLVIIRNVEEDIFIPALI